MGVLGQVEDPPDLGRAVRHEPVGGVSEVSGHRPIAGGYPGLTGDRDCGLRQVFLCHADRFELVEREHAIHLFDERNKPLDVRRRQPAEACEPLRQHERVIHPLP